MGQHLRRMREIYASRLEVLAERARRELKGLMDLASIPAGLHTIGWLAKDLDDAAASRLAAARGIDSVALSTLGINRRMPPALILGVASGDVRAIRRGVTGVAGVLRDLKSGNA